jgi:hypothetical protein
MEKGVRYCLRAGEKARNLYANEAAIRHLTAALELLEALPEDEPRLRQRWWVAFNLELGYVHCRVFERALDVLQGYLALAQRAGYPRGIVAAHREMAWALRWSHEAAGIDGSESSRRLRVEHLEKSVQVADQHGLTDWRARARVELADLLSYHGHGADLPQAEMRLREMLEAPEGLPMEDIQAAYGRLLQICALQGQWSEAAAVLGQSIPFGQPSTLYRCLGTMEEALNRAGKQAEFIAFCGEAKALYAQAGVPIELNQWYLEPAGPSDEFRQLLFRDEFEAPELGPEWQWHDPVQASSYNLLVEFLGFNIGAVVIIQR